MDFPSTSQHNPNKRFCPSGYRSLDNRQHCLNTLPSDFTILCQQSENDNMYHEFKVHAFMLKKYAVFDAMLDSGMREQEDKQMKIVGWNSQVVDKFIQFLYNDWVYGIESMAESLLKLAHKYGVSRLVTLCGRVIPLTGEHAKEPIAAFDFAIKYNVASLKMKLQRELPAQVATFTTDQLAHVLTHGQEMRMLADACEKRLVQMMTSDDVFELHELACNKACVVLYDATLAYIESSWNELRKSKPEQTAEFSKLHAECCMTGDMGFPSNYKPTQPCSQCLQPVRSGEYCQSCGTMRPTNAACSSNSHNNSYLRYPNHSIYSPPPFGQFGMMNPSTRLMGAFRPARGGGGGVITQPANGQFFPPNPNSELRQQQHAAALRWHQMQQQQNLAAANKANLPSST